MSTFAALATEEAVVFTVACVATIWLRRHLAHTRHAAHQSKHNSVR